MTRDQAKWIFAAGAAVLSVLPAATVFAQTSGKQNDRPTAPADRQDCVAPADPSQKTDRVPQEGDDLPKTLDDCNGVLKAPETSDKGLVTPAPDTGNSRVIAPGDVPDNANPSNGSGG